jgi:streptogramin lyase
MAVRRTGAGELMTIFFVTNALGSTALAIWALGGAVMSWVTLDLPARAKLSSALHVDAQERVWLVDDSNTVSVFNSIIGAVPFNFTAAERSAFTGYGCYHQFAVSDDSSRLWLTTYGAEDIVVLSSDGEVLDRWSSQQVVLQTPVVLQLKKTGDGASTLLSDTDPV